MKERKTFYYAPEIQFEIKEDDGGGYIEGIAATFDTITDYQTIMKRGAFKKTLQDRLPKGLIKLFSSHENNVRSLIGVIVEAEERAAGLWIRAKLSATALAQEVKTKIKEGILNQFSIGFTVIQYKDVRKDKKMYREFYEVMLIEISVVPLGACPGTSIDVVQNKNIDTNNVLLSLQVAEIEMKAHENDLLTTDVIGVIKQLFELLPVEEHPKVIDTLSAEPNIESEEKDEIKSLTVRKGKMTEKELRVAIAELDLELEKVT